MVLTVALIGAGVQVRDSYLPVLLDSPVLQLKAVYSRTLNAAERLRSSLPTSPGEAVVLYSNETSDNFGKLIENTEIDAVIIALPIQHQAKFVQAALKAGKHVLSEKPLAHDVDTASGLIVEYDALQKADRVPTWLVAENWPLIPAYRLAADEVQRLGRVLGFRSRQSLMMSKDSPFLTSEWRAAPELNGGLLLDGAVHGIAVLRMLLGPGHDFATTCSFSNSLQSHLPAPDTLDAIVTTQNGVNGTMQISYGTTFQGPIFEIACENGVVLVEGFHAVRVMENEKEPQHLTAHGIEVSVAAVVEAWVKAIVDGGETSKSLLPSEALIDLRVIECMLRSAKLGGQPVQIR